MEVVAPRGRQDLDRIHDIPRYGRAGSRREAPTKAGAAGATSQWSNGASQHGLARERPAAAEHTQYTPHRRVPTVVNTSKRAADIAQAQELGSSDIDGEWRGQEEAAQGQSCLCILSQVAYDVRSGEAVCALQEERYWTFVS